MTQQTDLLTILTAPVPDQAVARTRKQGYRQYPVLTPSRQADEPLVDIALYGIAGQSYYSRPNRTTGAPVPGIDPTIRLRKSVAELLAAINHELQATDEIAKLFGGPVELYVEEGVRPLVLQEQLYEQTFPQFIAQHNPGLSQAQVLATRDALIAAPRTTGGVPPHATGAAFDLTLRHAHPDLAFVPKSLIPMGRKPGSSIASAPDYYEHKQPLASADGRLQRNRRIFYWVMRGVLLYDDTGLACNPDEWWHWSYGDQMWAALTQAPCAYFGEVDSA